MQNLLREAGRKRERKKKAEMINSRMGKGERTAELRKGALPDASIN